MLNCGSMKRIIIFRETNMIIDFFEQGKNHDTILSASLLENAIKMKKKTEQELMKD